MKILHIFNCKSKGFYSKLIDTIRNNDIFDSEEHYFLLRRKECFDLLENKHHVILDEDKGSLVKKYKKDFDAFILHSLDSLDEPHQIPRKLRKKVFWRTWGHDAGYEFVVSKNIFSMIKKDFRFLRQRREINQFAGIGIANCIDELDMKRRYGKRAKLYKFSYLSQTSINQSYVGNNVANEKKNILIGHSGYPGDMHIQTMKKLIPVKDKIEIFLPLTYGNKEYIKTVVSYANENFKNSAHFIFESLDFDSYCKLLSTMNFAFFPYRNSYALGNINIAIAYSVNLVLNSNGIIANAFSKEKIPFIDFNHFNPNTDLIFKEYDISQTQMRKRSYSEKLNDLKIVFDLLKNV